MSKKFEKELPVCGFYAVQALAEQHPENISRLFFSERTAKHFAKACKFLAEHKRVYRLVSDAELEKLSGSMHHQGVTAMIYEPVIQRLAFEQIDEWAKNAASVLMLDEVGNANNLGAIVRSAAFFGIEHIVITEQDRQAECTTAVYRVAQGGMEFVRLYKVSSTEWFLRRCRGKLTVLGTDLKAHYGITELRRFVEKEEACVVVLGNEEHGISGQVRSLCTHLIKIAGSGAVESLNVAQAAAVFCNALYALRG